MPHDAVVLPTRRPPPSVPPRPQHTRAVRADQLTGEQCTFDLDRVATYHHHWVPPAPSDGPSDSPKSWEGPSRVTERGHVLDANHRAHPLLPDQHVVTTSNDVTPTDRGHPVSRSTTDLTSIAEEINPQVRGWSGYYGAFYRTKLYSLTWRIDHHLIRWAMRKFTRLRGRIAKASAWLDAVQQRQPRLFAHWHLIAPTNGRPVGAV